MGRSQVEQVSQIFRSWYGPPVALANVPGNVYVTAGGEFIGPISVGNELTQADMIEALVRREAKRRFFRRAHVFRQSGAFANLQAALDASNGGKMQTMSYSKTTIGTGGTGRSGETWTRTGFPAVGGAGAAAPGGTATTNSTTGALPFINPSTADSAHCFGGSVSAGGTFGTANFLLIDQLFRVAKTMNSTATEAVTGTFARYQNSTATAADYIGGNFCFPANPTTNLANTAHNWNVCQYTDQAGTGGKNFSSTAGFGACAPGGVDIAAGNPFYMIPASGDVGVKALTQMQCSALVATGTMDFVVAHPIAMFTLSLALVQFMTDCLTTATSQLTCIYDNACLTFLDILKLGSNGNVMTGSIVIVSE